MADGPVPAGINVAHRERRPVRALEYPQHFDAHPSSQAAVLPRRANADMVQLLGVSE
jgi:hypothetical protein